MKRRDFLAHSLTLGGAACALPGVLTASGPDNEALLGFVGDLLVDRDRPIEAFEPVLDLLRAPDLMFGNLEGPYSDNPVKPLNAPVSLVPPAYNLDVFKPAGFDVISMANNHILDGGIDAMIETRDRLREQGIATSGAGADLAEARQPAALTANGLSVEVLSYASVFPMGYQASAWSGGLAPMRAHNHYYENLEGYYLPGSDPRVVTIPVPGDEQALKQDIRAARERADIVVASFHWGDHTKPFHLTDHEIRTGRFCIDQGADIVVGHHHHVLRGMEWWKGKPIFYGLGHFVFDIRIDKWPQDLLAGVPVLDDDSDYYGVAPRKGWPLMPLHREARMTAWAWARAGKSGVSEIGFVPCRLDPQGRVSAVDPESPEGREVVDYVDAGCRLQQINGKVERGRFVDLAGFRGVRILPAS